MPAGRSTNPTLDPDGKKLDRFLSQLKAAEEAHAPRIKRWKSMDDAYKGVVRGRDGKASQVDTEVYPLYALAAVETIKAGIDDDKPTLELTPTVVTAERVQGAKCLEDLIEWQRKRLGFTGERTKFIDQALRRGASIGKVPWIYETQMQSERRFSQPEFATPENPLKTLEPVGWTEPEEKVTKQGAGFFACDVIDCPWDPGATRWSDVTHLFYKTWVTLDELKRMQKLGAYDWPDEFTPKPSGAPDDHRETRAENRDRILLIERWELRSTGVQLTVVVNNILLVRDCPSPLRHGKLPFVYASTNPGMFTVEGMSEVEIVMEEQAAIWELLNQSIQNARYQNNACWFIDESLKGAIDIKLGPGELNWVTGDPNARIKQFQPVQTLQFAQPLIEMLIETMHAVSPANPYISGANSDAGTTDTATGIQLMQNMAGKRIQRKKEEILQADREIGLQQVQLTQMLLPKAVVWSIKDSSAEHGFAQMRVSPDQIQGEYDYDATEIADAVSKQQKQAKAGQIVATLLQVQQVAATLPPGIAPLINFSALIESFTEANDEPADKYLFADPAAGGAILGAQPAVPAPAGPPGSPGAAGPGNASPGIQGPMPPRGV